jgi:peptide/nickel transport system permease protein
MHALLPLVMVVGLQIGALLEGPILTETILAMPGIGRLAVDGNFARDLPIVQGVVLILALVRAASILLAGLICMRLDTRIAYVTDWPGTCAAWHRDAGGPPCIN